MFDPLRHLTSHFLGNQFSNGRKFIIPMLGDLASSALTISNEEEPLSLPSRCCLFSTVETASVAVFGAVSSLLSAFSKSHDH